VITNYRSERVFPGLESGCWSPGPTAIIRPDQECHITVRRVEAMETIDRIKNIDRPRWYAAYTLTRHEKAVADRLVQQRVESYLPLYSAVRCWNHRRVEVDLPL